MSTYMSILLFISMGVLVFSLGYTLAVTRRPKQLKPEADTPLPEKVQSHIYLRNPVFLSYGIFFVLLILIILFYNLS
ncbi:hypothetical protein [Robertmurraya korlensis]|uniref:hypothetical protein n=1 Tax=Robertmurraya korlensis TaxID=519977 RepID=UPI0008243F7E|nr:hypothetical protein [Robertmurraya korlensis]